MTALKGLTERLVTVAHGTRHAPGNDVAREITRRAGELLGVPAQATYVELCGPSLDSVMSTNQEPATVVPLLLSVGHHVRRDLPDALGRSPSPVSLTGALGPHALLAAAQVSRLLAAGAVAGEPVVMVAAGSRDPAADRDLAHAVALLAEAWAGPVTLATLSGRGRRPEQVVSAGVAVSPYLLAPGHFADRARDECRAAGAGTCAGVIGAHDRVVDLVVRRYRSAAGASAA